jgi:hypothetical protein
MRLVLVAGIAMALAGFVRFRGRAPADGRAIRMRGICLEARGPISLEHLEPLRRLGADWISQTPFGWSRGLHSPAIQLASQRVGWGESDSGLVQTASMARSLGMRTLLKPHLWVRHGAWCGDLEMLTEADWQAWFASYEAWILHYARLAEAHGMEAFAVGTELGKTTARTDDWRRIIAGVRAVYHGPITYCANWRDEAERIEFWDGLDFIGIQAYYPVAATAASPRRSEMAASWTPVVAELACLARRSGKPIVFTEVGYRSVTDGLREPWRWETDGEQDLDLQCEAFAALFEAFWGQSWFGGTFIWKWHPGLETAVGRAGRDFTPQGKPALDVIRTAYTGAAP